MTTFQEPPLQSRRAVRENERVEPADSQSRAPAGGEPLNYVTQNRPLLPGYGAAPQHGRRAAEGSDHGEQPEGANQQGAVPSFRVRDYSPEGRRVPPAWIPQDEAPDGGVVSYHTQARAAVTPGAEPMAAAEPFAAQPFAPAPIPPLVTPAPMSLATALNQPGDASELTLTRRELRALREAHGITAVPTDATPVVPPTETPLAAASPELRSALAEFDSLSSPEPAPRSGRRAAPQPDTAAGNFESLFTPPALVPPVMNVPAPTMPASGLPGPLPLDLRPTPASQPVVEQPAPRPVGHWTNQADLDDREQVTGSTTSRLVGSGALTTSALVLPSLPGQDLSTGEILVTGSIDLPRSMSSLGAHPSQVDESDLDHLLDPGDHQVVSTDSIPIRASRAISSHTSTRGVIASNKSRGNRDLTALIISAAVMAVVVVTLLVVALATNVL